MFLRRVIHDIPTKATLQIKQNHLVVTSLLTKDSDTANKDMTHINPNKIKPLVVLKIRCIVILSMNSFAAFEILTDFAQDI